MANWYCVTEGFPASSIPVIGIIERQRFYKSGEIVRLKEIRAVIWEKCCHTRQRGWQNWYIYSGVGWRMLLSERRMKNFTEYCTVTHWAEIPPIPEGLL